MLVSNETKKLQKEKLNNVINLKEINLGFLDFRNNFLSCNERVSKY